MIKLGILDFDTSHVIEFTKRLNHKGIAEDQVVDGAEVVIGCPGESKIMPERIPGYIQEMKKLGVRLVDNPKEMIGKVDGMLIESQEGSALGTSPALPRSRNPLLHRQAVHLLHGRRQEDRRLGREEEGAGVQLVLAALCPGADRIRRRH